MTYLKVAWTHTFENEPVELLSELDSSRRETRKVERFRDGSLRFAGPTGGSGDTVLSEDPLPPVDVITQDPQFSPIDIDHDQFERVWRDAIMSKAA